ncbi:double zinc ribbon domain-containing protein [Uliginosibacterium flavum]|uniref:zinc ribbon domain-containing protein n=1 Tax=Uliginosibacterium flavum TaxID=1396831 RepID=UPI003F4A6C1B
MICSKCQCTLNDDAKFCGECGQAVAPSLSMGFPCVLCGAPIPVGAEGCTQCGKAADGEAAGADTSLPAPSRPTAPTSAPFSPEPGAPDFSVTPVATSAAPDVIKIAEPEPADNAEMDIIELDAFQLDAIEIPPPPPPPAPRVVPADTFAPLPSLTEALKPRIEPVEPVLEPIVIEPEPVATEEPPPRPAPVPVPVPAPMAPLPAAPVKSVSAEPVRAPAPSIPPTTPVPAEEQTVLATPAPSVQPRTAAAPVWPGHEEEELGPQPEDVVDEFELRRRRTIRQLIIAAVILVLALATFATLMRAQPWKKKPAPPVTVQSQPAPTPAPALTPAISPPPALESAPTPAPDMEAEPEEEAPVQAAPKTKPARATTKPAARSEPKPTRKNSEEDAYMRQIRRQLEQR